MSRVHKVAVGILAIALLMAPAIPSLAQTGATSSGAGTIFIPLISDYEIAATAEPTLLPDQERVYGLLGTLRAGVNEQYASYLVTESSGEYGLAGETPEIELKIDQLRRDELLSRVKVWGVVHNRRGAKPMIVVTGILSAGPAPTESGATPVVGLSAPVAIVRFDLVNLYAGPGQSFARTGQVTLNQACDIIGRDRSSTWWQIDCASGLRGWIDARLVEVEGRTNTVPIVETVVAGPTIEPQPVATATPVPTPRTFQGWRVEMYANARLSGEPVVVDDVESISFDWGSVGPNALMPVDNFSMRFERTISFSPGYYRFSAQADDGVRVWLDNQIIIDEWGGATGRVFTVGRTLSGQHDLRVEYYEGSGLALLRFGYERFDQTPDWEASYYANTNLSGTPVLVQNEPRSLSPLDVNWVLGSPAPDVLGTDFWSARWEGQFQFDYGTYIFRIAADDGVRVYVDGLRVIDQWRDGYKEASNSFVGIGSGTHTITVEYYERTGSASLRVWWYRDSGTAGPQ